MERHLTEEGGVNLKGLVLACLLLVSLVSSLVLIQPISAKPAVSSSKFVKYVKELEPIAPSAPVEKPDVNVISLRENFDEPQFGTENNYDTINIAGCGATSSPGEPTVPAKTIIVLLPPGKDVSNIEVTPVSQMQVERKLYLYPGQEPAPVGASSPEFTRPNAEFYSSSAPYPSQESYELEFVTSYRGYKLAVMKLFPIQYIPAERRAIFYPELDVQVELKPASEAGLAFRPTADVDEWIKNHVENPELMGSYKFLGIRWRRRVPCHNPPDVPQRPAAPC